jgi:quinoprotein glucose dehydrogenase
MIKLSPNLALFLSCLIGSLGQPATPVAAQQGTKDGQWPSYGGDVGSTRYAPLDQINRDNFKDLKVAWSWESPDGLVSKSESGGEWRADIRTISAALAAETPNLYRRGGEPRFASLKATPLVVDGMMYVSTPLYQAAGIDARTGRTVWVYDPKSYASGTPTNSLMWNARGCAYWADGQQSRVIWGTGDGYLIAVDAKTGRPCADFGDKGRVDLTVGIPRAERGKRDELNAQLWSMSSPPVVVRDVVITGSAVSDRRTTKENPPGWVRGWDARTGQLKWAFHTVPLDGEAGAETWEEGANDYSGNVNVWSMMSGDAELGYVYVPLTTPSNDFYGGHRLGDNLFAECLVCLDVETGQRIWHFQAVHHGLWDYDFPSAPILLDVAISGRPRKIVAQFSKQAFCYVFDRVTGEPIWPIVEKPVPTEPHLPGERPAPTQPHPTRPAPVAGQGTTEDQVIDFTPELHKQAMEILARYQTGPLFTPPTLATPGGTWGTIQRPSIGGATNWSGACADPESGYVFVPSRDTAGVIYFYTPRPEQGGTVRYTHGGRPPEGVTRLQGPQGLPMWKPPYSRMTAIDMHSGDHAWMKPSGMGASSIRNHPALKGIELPPLGGEPRGGPIVTKTVLISWKGGSLRGEEGGREEPSEPGGGPGLVAYDKVTGEEVGFAPLPAPPIGTPMTYMIDDRQYIALTVAGSPPRIVALSLPEVETTAAQ